MTGMTRGILVLLMSISMGKGMEMMDPSERPEFHPINPGSKTFHWLLTLLFLFLLPSITCIYTLANRFNVGLFLQVISGSYSLIETLFLRFPDPNNHENSTSYFTSWILTIVTGIVVLLGLINNGSRILIKSDISNSKLLINIYKILSCLLVIIGWVRTCLAVVALFGFCYGKHTGQCIAHGIMGTAFIGYSFVLSLVLIIPWIRKAQLNNIGNQKFTCQEFYDSSLIMVWGIVNTFTEHRWGKEDWSMGDYQHTAMGIIWWCGGILGMWLSRNNNRTFVPGLILIFTGYSMSQHAQHLEISTKIHAIFGISLMGAGISRIIEISFLLKDKSCSSNGDILSFQYFPPFLLTFSGILFMGANEEQLVLVNDLGSDSSAYLLVVSSAAFMIFLWFQLMLELYLRLVGYDKNGSLHETAYQEINQQVEEFELANLSDEEAS